MKGISIKVIAVLLGLPLLVAVADWAWTQGPVYQYRTDGVSANYVIEETFAESVGTGTVFSSRRASVDVSEGAEAMATGGISGPYFWLNFNVSVNTPSGSGYAYGSGPIPAAYFTFDKPVNKNLTLTVDTESLALPFYKNRYGTIDVPFPIIDLTWTRTGNDWYRWEGHRVSEIGILVEHSQGSGVRYFTIPMGTITMPDLGLPVWSTYMDGWLGSEKSRVRVMQRGPVP